MRGFGYSWLQVDQDGSRDVVFVIGLVEEYVFSVIALAIDCFFLEYALRVDSMLLAELLPELNSD